MRGQVLGVDTRTGVGIVAGSDGVRYQFTPEDWAHRGEPSIGMHVDFETDQTRALALFPVPEAPRPLAPSSSSAKPRSDDRNKFIAAILAFLVGTLGVHRFYLGRIGSGITMLVLTCTIVGLIISVPWAFIDMIRYLMMSNREFDARYARDAD